MVWTTDLNYASLSANTIYGAGTDISAAYGLVFVDHWKNGRLNLKHCKDITIKRITNINLNTQGTDVFIGTLLNSGLIKSAYGDLEIKNVGVALNDLELFLDYSSAMLPLPANAVDFTYKGNKGSTFELPKKYKVVSDTEDGIYRVVKAYNQKRYSGNVLSVLANHGAIIIKWISRFSTLTLSW